MKLRRFNQGGIREFEAYLDLLSVDPGAEFPSGLIDDPRLSDEIFSGGEIENRQLTNRMIFASYLDTLLAQVTDLDYERETGFWVWLTAFFFDQVCPIDGNGFRKVGERARYVPAIGNFQKYYRHLLAGPYRIYRAHRDNPARALVLLCGPLARPGDIVEQLVARQEVITNSRAVEVATLIYYDDKTGKFRRGAAGKGGGSARRFADVLAQFDVTWDLYCMSVPDILAKLPKEFDRFKSVIDR